LRHAKAFDVINIRIVGVFICQGRSSKVSQEIVSLKPLKIVNQKPLTKGTDRKL